MLKNENAKTHTEWNIKILNKDKKWPCICRAMSCKGSFHVNELWEICVWSIKFFPKKMKISDLVNFLNALYKTLPLLLSLLPPSLSPFHSSFLSFWLYSTVFGISPLTRDQTGTFCIESSVLILGPPGTFPLTLLSTWHPR